MLCQLQKRYKEDINECNKLMSCAESLATLERLSYWKMAMGEKPGRHTSINQLSDVSL